MYVCIRNAYRTRNKRSHEITLNRKWSENDFYRESRTYRNIEAEYIHTHHTGAYYWINQFEFQGEKAASQCIISTENGSECRTMRTNWIVILNDICIWNHRNARCKCLRSVFHSMPFWFINNRLEYKIIPELKWKHCSIPMYRMWLFHFVECVSIAHRFITCLWYWPVR